MGGGGGLGEVGCGGILGTWCSGCGVSRETTSYGSEVEFPKNIMDGVEFHKKTYGGCEGSDVTYVKSISSDGHEFIVKREHA